MMIFVYFQSTSPVFTWGPNVETVVVGGRFSVLLNMSVPENTSARYVVSICVMLCQLLLLVGCRAVPVLRYWLLVIVAFQDR